MISKTQQNTDGYGVMRQISVDKSLSLDLKTDFSSADEGESDSLCSFHVPPTHELPCRHQSNIPLVRKLHVSFENISSCHCDVPEPAPKRRKFQRRNSKTAKMMSMSMLPILSLDLAEKEKTTLPCPEYDEDINIAEDLVRHFQASRKRARSMRLS